MKPLKKVMKTASQINLPTLAGDGAVLGRLPGLQESPQELGEGVPLPRQQLQRPGQLVGLDQGQQLLVEAVVEGVAVGQGEAEGPVVFHCTAGKDRTGFAAALPGPDATRLYDREFYEAWDG